MSALAWHSLGSDPLSREGAWEGGFQPREQSSFSSQPWTDLPRGSVPASLPHAECFSHQHLDVCTRACVTSLHRSAPLPVPCYPPTTQDRGGGRGKLARTGADKEDPDGPEMTVVAEAAASSPRPGAGSLPAAVPERGGCWGSGQRVAESSSFHSRPQRPKQSVITSPSKNLSLPHPLSLVYGHIVCVACFFHILDARGVLAAILSGVPELTVGALGAGKPPSTWLHVCSCTHLPRGPGRSRDPALDLHPAWPSRVTSPSSVCPAGNLR